jgi:hypothetical protein
MKSLLIVFFTLTTICLSAQDFSSDLWHEGMVVSSDRDTIRGLVKYDMVSNTVLVSRNNVVQTFSSYKLFYAEINDQLLGNFRQFYSVPYALKYDYDAPILFELLYEGPFSLLAREAIVKQTSSANSAYYGMPVVQNVLLQSYYFLDKKGHIDYYSGKKADLLSIMRKHETQVKQFIKSNKLQVSDVRDLVRITAFYNSLE